MAEYSTEGCKVPYLTLLDPSTGAALSDPCAVSYAELAGSNYSGATAFFSLVSGLSLLAAVIQTVRMFRTYGYQASLASHQVWMHLRVVLMYFSMFVHSWDRLFYTSWFPYQLWLICRIVSNLMCYLTSFALMFVWHRTGTELAQGSSQTVDFQERVVTGIVVTSFGGLLLVALVWTGLPLWAFDSALFGVMAFISTGINILNVYFGSRILHHLAVSSKFANRKSAGNFNIRTFFTEKNDQWKVLRVLIMAFCLATSVTVLQVVFSISASKTKYGIKVNDNHKPVSRTLSELFSDSILFFCLYIFGWIILFSFSNIRKRTNSTSRPRSAPPTPKLSRQPSASQDNMKLDASKKIPSFENIPTYEPISPRGTAPSTSVLVINAAEVPTTIEEVPQEEVVSTQ